VVFQLEEGEISTEPVPARDQRRAILLYEATEGGAGVLGRLTSDVTALARVARKALELMHFDNIDAAVAAADPEKLATQPDTRCVVGCYRCLLSYYNQPDHELIDRTDAQVISLLMRLSRSTITVEQRATPGDPAAARDPSEVDWRDAVARWGLPKPDPEPLRLDGGASLPLAWANDRVAASIGQLDPAARAAAEALGYAVTALPNRPGGTPPSELTQLFGGTQ